MLDVSSSTIQKIRRGQAYKNLFPEIERKHERIEGPRCHECVHLHQDEAQGRCTLEIPEHRTRGSLAAAVCAAYHPKQACSAAVAV